MQSIGFPCFTSCRFNVRHLTPFTLEFVAFHVKLRHLCRLSLRLKQTQHEEYSYRDIYIHFNCSLEYPTDLVRYSRASYVEH